MFVPTTPPPAAGVTMVRTRRDINGRIREELDRRGIAFTFGCEDEREGLRYTIDGEKLTTGQAADLYLRGGFAGNFGRA